MYFWVENNVLNYTAYVRKCFRVGNMRRCVTKSLANGGNYNELMNLKNLIPKVDVVVEQNENGISAILSVDGKATNFVFKDTNEAVKTMERHIKEVFLDLRRKIMGTNTYNNTSSFLVDLFVWMEMWKNSSKEEVVKKLDELVNQELDKIWARIEKYKRRLVNILSLADDTSSFNRLCVTLRRFIIEFNRYRYLMYRTVALCKKYNVDCRVSKRYDGENDIQTYVLQMIKPLYMRCRKAIKKIQQHQKRYTQ